MAYDPDEVLEKLQQILQSFSEVMNITGENVDTVARKLEDFGGGAISDFLKELGKVDKELRDKLIKSLEKGGDALKETANQAVEATKGNVAVSASLEKVNERSRVIVQESKKLIKSYADTNEQIHKQVKAKELEARHYKDAVQATDKYIGSQENLKNAQQKYSDILDNSRKAHDAYNKMRKKLQTEGHKLSEQERSDLEIKVEASKNQVKQYAKELRDNLETQKDYKRQLNIIEEEGFEERQKAYVEASQHSSKFSDIFKGAVIGSLMNSEKPLKSFTNMMDNAYSEKKRKSITQMGKAFTDLFDKGETGDRKLSTRFKNFGKGMANSVGSATKAVGAKAMGVGGAIVQKLMATLGTIAQKIGDLTGITTLIKPLETIASAISEMMESMVENAFKFQRSLGASNIEASKIATELTATADFMRLGPDAIKTMNESFQSLVEYTNSYRMNIKDTVGLVAKISEGTQISTSESAQFTSQMKNGLKMSNEEIEHMVSTLRQDAQGAGVSFKLVMQDVAKNGARMALYGEQIAMGIQKAALRAREMGGELTTWTGLMDSFGDGWEGVTTFVTDFNRLAGPGLLDIWDLQQKRMSGDVEGFQETIINAMKNVDKTVREGYLGKRFQKMLGMNEDEYAKLLQRLDIEDFFEKQIGDVERTLSSKGGLFGIMAGDDGSFTKSLDKWKKSMIDANRNVDEELRKMQQRAFQTALDEAMNTGVVKNAEEFAERLKKGDRSDDVVKGFQRAMRQGIDFQSFDDMNEALEKSLSPQQSMEAMIKQLVKVIMPSILEMMGWLVKGIGTLVDVINYSKIGPKNPELGKFASRLDIMGDQFAYMGETFKKQNIDTDFAQEIAGSLQQAFDLHMGDNKVDVLKLYNTDQKELIKQLEALNKKEGIGEQTSKFISNALDKLDERQRVEEDINIRKKGAQRDVEETAKGKETIIKIAEETAEKATRNVTSTMGPGVGFGYDIANKAINWFVGSDYEDEKKKNAKKRDDVAFSPGKARYILDTNDQMYELNPRDAVVASTNFDFALDNIATGKAMPEGSLRIKSPLTTDGLGGKSGFTKRSQWESGKSDILEDITGMMQRAVGMPPSAQDKKYLQDNPDKGTPENVPLGPWGSMSGLSAIPPEFGLNKETGGFLVSDAVDALVKLNKEWMEKGGKQLKLSSAFRASLEKDKEALGLKNSSQEYLHDMWVAGKPGFNRANRPGKSMHEAGLAIDIANKSVKTSKLFREELAPKYGFSPIATEGEKHHFAFVTSKNYSPIKDKEAVNEFRQKFGSGTDLAASVFEAFKNWTGIGRKKDDIAFSSGMVKYILDSYGNVYKPQYDESILATTLMDMDGLLQSRNAHFLKAGSIYQKIPVPSLWHKKSKELMGEDMFNQYIHDKDFRQIMSLAGGFMPTIGGTPSTKFANWALEQIGYNKKDIDSILEANRVAQLYNELFYGYDPSIKETDRKIDIDWRKNFLSDNVGDQEMISKFLGSADNEVLNLIGKHEGGYGSLNPNDVGKPSYGRIQLRGKKFQKLLKDYLETDGQFVNQLMTYKDSIEKWDNDGLTIASNKQFQALVKKMGDDPVMRELQDERANSGYLQPAKLKMENLGLNSLGSYYVLADTAVNGGLDSVLTNYGAQAYPTDDELKWTENFLDKRLERYKNLKTWDENGRGWERRINRMKEEVPDLVTQKINDAYFGRGEVQAILGIDGTLYRPSERDNVAVGTQLPNVNSKTSLAEGKLVDYLSAKTGGADSGASQRQTTELKRAYDKAQRDNDMLMDKMDRLIRAVRESGGSGGGGDVVIDGAKIGRFVDTNKNTSRRKGLTLNG